MNKSNTKLNKMIKISLLGAIAVILMFIEFPVLPAFPWLKMDLSELPVLMGAFAFGPVAGILIEGLKILLHLLLKGTQTGFIGETANFIVGVALVVPASYIYNRNKSKKTAILGMIVGAITMEIVAIIANVYFLLPAFGMNFNAEQTMQYVTAGLLPFNGIKAILVSAVTFVVYKKVSVEIFKVDSGFGRKKELSKES
jgi:riboflavin transporter FmnP